VLERLAYLACLVVLLDVLLLLHASEYGLTMGIESWQLSGYSDVKGGVGKPIPGDKIYMPASISIEGQFLKWELFSAGTTRPMRIPRKELLNDFVKLWNGAESKILAFAQKNGVLMMDGDPIKGREPLERWRTLSRVACAMLNIGAELAAGKKRIDREELKYLLQAEEDELYKFEDPEIAGIALMHAAEHWLAGISFSLDRKGREFVLRIDYHGRMLRAVALQLAITISRSESLYICSGCGLPYGRSAQKRRPKPGQANFCDDCGNEAALRHADARRKAKMADAQRLHEKGLPSNEIAKRLNTTPASVRRWVKKPGC
jgi:hypothetical protein